MNTRDSHPSPDRETDDLQVALDPVDDLLDVLDLHAVGSRRIEVSSDSSSQASTAPLYEGRSQPMPHGRVFGGQVLAQCIMAAGHTVDEVDTRLLHSLHGYFLRPGDSNEPIQFQVEQMRDGRSFSARRVHALQHGNILLSMICSFQELADGLDHQDDMPDAPDPDTIELDPAVLARLEDPTARNFAQRQAIQLRHVDGQVWTGPVESRDPHQRVWLRPSGTLPNSQLVHAAVLAYASDYSLLESILRRHGLSWSDPRLRPASLDHAMWFHRPFSFNDWVLYDQRSPSAQSGRGLGIGRMFTRDGTLVASVAQEGMVRLKE